MWWPLRGQRAWVWGGCGFVGRHLVPALLAHGAEVTVLTRPVAPALEPAWRSAVSWYVIDGDADYDDVLASTHPPADVVYDLAGASGAAHSHLDPLASLDSICRAQLLFLDACRRHGRAPHVVFVSTRLVYAPHGAAAIAEDARLEPRSLYAVHKLGVEHYLRVFSRLTPLTYTILRASPIFGFDGGCGPREHGIVNTFIRCGLRGEPITLFGDGRQLRDFLYIADFVDALLAAAVAPAARNTVINVGSGERLRLRDAAEIIRSLTGGPPIRYVPWPADCLAVETGDYVADINRCRALLDMSPRTSFAIGAALTVRAYTAGRLVRSAVAR